MVVLVVVAVMVAMVLVVVVVVFVVTKWWWRGGDSLCNGGSCNRYKSSIVKVEVGSERYWIFVSLSKVRMLIPCLNCNKILLPGQLPLSHEYYFLRSRQEFLVPLYLYIPGRDNTSCTQLQQNK